MDGRETTTLAFAGDVMLGRGVNEALRDMAPEEPWGDFLPILLNADARLINLECALTAHVRRWRWTPKVFYFRADPSAVNVLQAAQISACSLANNHTLDYEEEGLLDTLQTLRSAGIAFAGAGRDLDEVLRPALFRAGSTTVGLVALTDNEPDFAAEPGKPGTRFVPVSTDEENLRSVAAQIAQAREKGAEIVIVSDHWGPNMRLRPPLSFRAFAHAMIDAGADLFFGHSAHLFQGIELYRGKPILYDTGDFIDDYVVDPELRNDWSFLFLCTFLEGRPALLELVPAKLSFARVDVADEDEAEVILGRMTVLCEELGTTVVRWGDRLLIDVQRANRAVGEVVAGT